MAVMISNHNHCERASALGASHRIYDSRNGYMFACYRRQRRIMECIFANNGVIRVVRFRTRYSAMSAMSPCWCMHNSFRIIIHFTFGAQLCLDFEVLVRERADPQCTAFFSRHRSDESNTKFGNFKKFDDALYADYSCTQ